MMYGKPQNNTVKLVSPQSSLLISAPILPDGNMRALLKDYSQQVLNENQLAHHLDSRAVDSAFHFLKATGLPR
jgi:hypothetical protein